MDTITIEISPTCFIDGSWSQSFEVFYKLVENQEIIKRFLHAKTVEDVNIVGVRMDPMHAVVQLDNESLDLTCTPDLPKSHVYGMLICFWLKLQSLPEVVGRKDLTMWTQKFDVRITIDIDSIPVHDGWPMSNYEFEEQVTLAQRLSVEEVMEM